MMDCLGDTLIPDRDYLEQIFPFLGIRFIAVNDNYDSDLEEGGLDIAFKNLVYDYYSRDLSKKERIAKTRLAEQGKCGASQAMYGYRKIPGDKHSLEVDPEAAEVVRDFMPYGVSAFQRTLRHASKSQRTSRLDSITG